jgi:hypothetical protein
MGLALTLEALGESRLALGRVRVRLAPILAVAALAGSASATLVLLAR